MKKLFTFLFAALMSVASMWAQTETLLTTITATAKEQASYSTANVATVSFSYTAGGSSAYHALWGWWGYGWSATVNAAEGYTITKCVFYDDANRTATDSEAPFVVETTEEDKTPKVNGTPILEWTSKGIKKIDVYGYATPEPDPAKYYIVGTMNSWQVDENYEMNPSLEAETEEYFYTLDLTTSSEFKVVKVQNGQQSWIPEGMGNNYGQNGEITEDGEYTVYFRPNFDGGEDWFYSCIYAEKTGEFVPETPTYYLIGDMTGWDVDENYELNPNIDSDIEEYFYVLDLTTTNQFKVVKVQNGQQSWFPSGMDNNYGQNGEITEDGEYTVYFRPNYNGGEDWFYNCIYVSKNEPEPAGEVTVVFAANDKTVERTVTLPHTFKCDWAAGMDEPDELDIIIHELYNDYYYCNNNIQASGSDQVEVGTEEDPKNDYITIKGVFEGTATVTGDYFDWITGEEGAHNYSITISIKGSEPEPTGVENVQTNQVQATKFFRDGQLLIERDGKIFNVTGAQVK